MSQLLLPLLAVLVLAGCQAADQPRPAAVTDLAGRTWILVSLGGQALALPAEQRAPTLEFQAASGRIAAFGGVNRLSGAYVMAGAALHISGLIATRMAGPAEAMAVETAYSRVLNGVQGWTMVDGQLALHGTGGAARFRATP